MKSWNHYEVREDGMSRKHSVPISKARMKGKIFNSKTSTGLKIFLLGNKNLSTTTKSNMIPAGSQGFDRKDRTSGSD